MRFEVSYIILKFSAILHWTTDGSNKRLLHALNMNYHNTESSCFHHGEIIVPQILWASFPVICSQFTSKSFMTGTGLKKCNPPNRSFLFVTDAIS